ncbi:MAG: hypothetical protein Ta2B_25600 [Termitinemataceae bacterium]|nr:MAG: hypothetical protein Ta2B_25600 [Termitinemataceae bacterium]
MYNKTLAYLLWFLSGCGWFGLHRFYLGKPFTAVLWICTGGLAGIGSLYDLITLGSQVDYANKTAKYNRQDVHHYYHAGENAENMRYANDADVRILHGNDDGRTPDSNDSVERKILKIAKTKGGIVSVSEVSLEANISLDDAKKNLEMMTKKGYVQMRVRQSGTIVFTFPEFIDKDSPLEEF